jgi:hypothetical protein
MLQRNTTITLCERLTADPTCYILRKFSRDDFDMNQRISFLAQLAKGADDAVAAGQNANAKNTGMGICSAFAAATCIAGATTNPFGWAIVALAATAGLVSIGSAVKSNADTAPVLEKLRRVRAVLLSPGSKMQGWASLWALVGTDEFCDYLDAAGSGSLHDGKIHSKDGLNPFTQAVTYCAQRHGMEVDAVITAMRQQKTLSSATSALPQTQAPAALIGAATQMGAIEAVVQTAPIIPTPPPVAYTPNANDFHDAAAVWSDDEQSAEDAILAAEARPSVMKSAVEVLPTTPPPPAPEDVWSEDELAEFMSAPLPYIPTEADRLLALGSANPLQPVLIVGSPGSGKGMFASAALADAVSKGAEVWVIDPKSDRKEAGYWAGVSRHYLLDPAVNDDIGAQTLSILAEFGKRQYNRKNELEPDDKPLILFIDEVNTVAANMTTAELAVFGKRVVTLAGQGRSQNVAVWLGAQAVILEMLGIKGESNRDIFSQVVCVNGSDTHKAFTILKNLGMDQARLKVLNPNIRYWLTPAANVDAPILAAPPISAWGENVIDLRPSPDAPITAGKNDLSHVEVTAQATPAKESAPKSEAMVQMERTMQAAAKLIKDAGVGGIRRSGEKGINSRVSTALRPNLDRALDLLVSRYGYKFDAKTETYSR